MKNEPTSFLNSHRAPHMHLTAKHNVRLERLRGASCLEVEDALSHYWRPSCSCNTLYMASKVWSQKSGV